MLKLENQEACASSVAPFLEVIVTSHNQYGRGHGRSNDCSRDSI
jgi:hypothetical protein